MMATMKLSCDVRRWTGVCHRRTDVVYVDDASLNLFVLDQNAWLIHPDAIKSTPSLYGLLVMDLICGMLCRKDFTAGASW